MHTKMTNKQTRYCKPAVWWISSIVYWLSVLSLHGQIYYSDHHPLATPAEIQNMWQQADSIRSQYANEKFHCKRMDILELKGEKYLLPDGRFDVYKWDSIHWVPLYMKFYFGYNHDAKKFVHQDTLFSYGGTGYWESHGDVIWFDFKLGEWNRLPFSANLFLGAASYHEGKLFVNGPETYILNVSNRQIIRKASNELKDVNWQAGNLETLEGKSFTFFAAQGILLDKKTGLLYKDEKEVMQINSKKLTDTSFLIQIAGDSLIAYENYNRKAGLLFPPALLPIHFSQLTEEISYPLIIYLAIIGCILLLIGFVWTLKPDSRTSPEETPREMILLPNLKQVIQTLQEKEGSIINSEALDAYFGLGKITSLDTLRYKRAQMIKEINQSTIDAFGYELIMRKPDPSDGRRFVYLIQKKSPES